MDQASINLSFFSVFRNIVLYKEIFSAITLISKIEKRKVYKYDASVSWICENGYFGLIRDKLLLNPKKAPPMAFQKQDLKIITQHVEDIDVFKIIFEQEKEEYVTNTSIGINQAAANKNIEILKFLDTHELKLSATTDAMDNAARAGLLNNLKYLKENRTEGATCLALENAAEKGNIEVVEWIYENRSSIDGLGKAIDAAAVNGNLQIIKYLTEKNKTQGATPRAVDLASQQGKIEIVEYLLENRTEFCTHDAITYASLNNRLDLLKVLHKYNAPASKAAMDNAAIQGSLEIIKFLSENRTEGCSDSAIGFACMNRHSEVAKYLIERGYPATIHAMNNASFVGDIEVVKLLHNHGFGCNQFGIDLAAQGGHLEVVEFLHINRTEGATKRAMDLAALRGFLPIVQYLHFNRTEGCTKDAMDMAAHCGHLGVIQFLHQNRTEGCSQEALRNAVMHGRTEIVKFLVENRTEIKVPTSKLENEVKYPEIHEYLKSKRPQKKSVARNPQIDL